MLIADRERGHDEGVQREAAVRGVDPAAHPGLRRRLPPGLPRRARAPRGQVQEQDVGVSIHFHGLQTPAV